MTVRLPSTAFITMIQSNVNDEEITINFMESRNTGNYIEEVDEAQNNNVKTINLQCKIYCEHNNISSG